MIILQQPSKIIFGINSSENIVDDDLVISSEKLLVLIAEPLFSQFKPIINTLISREKNVKPLIYNYPGEPTFSQFNEMLEISTAFNPDCVIGIGGGSVLDSAKLLAAMTDNEQVYTEVIGVGLLRKRMKKLICIPTTSGTGSEVSPIAILLNEKTNSKNGIVSQALLADAAYIDPALTKGLPPKFTAETGIDALCHCIEAYTNKYAHPTVDLYAIEGIRLISQNLIKAYTDGNDLDARSAMALGSMYGGLCLGPVNTHAVHCLSYGLGGKFHISHGLANAMLLPAVLRFNLDANPERNAAIAMAMGIKFTNDNLTTAILGIEMIENLCRKCGIPDNLNEVGVRSTDIEELADIAMGVTRLLKNNPRELTKTDAINIYQSLLK